MNYMHDTRSRKVVITVVCFLDSLHLVFSAIMIYLSMMDPLNHPAPNLVWTLKGMATSKGLLIVVVQSYYLRIIWTFAGNSTVNSTITSVIRTMCLLLFSYAVAVLVAFLTYLEGIESFSDFSKNFQRMIYVGFGSTAIIDSIIAVVLSYLLFKTSPPNHQRFKSRGVVRFLVLFFIGTGVLTAIAAIATITVYVTKPSTVLYLAIEFSCPRLYANSILAMFNSKARLRQRMQATTELKISSMLLFGDGPDSSSTEGSPGIELEGAPDAV